MQYISPAGLAILLAVPLIVAITTRRRRLPVRRVAGVYLWQDAAQSAAQVRDLAGWSRSALIRDVLAVVGLALLACGLFTTEASDAGERAHWLLVAGRTLACVAIAALLSANWRRRLRG